MIVENFFFYTGGKITAQFQATQFDQITGTTHYWLISAFGFSNHHFCLFESPSQLKFKGIWLLKSSRLQILR